MHALARSDSPSPGPQAPTLHAVDVPDGRPARGLSAWDVARYALGLTIGFLLAAVASAPGGAGIAAVQLALGATAAGVGLIALARHRVARARDARARAL